MGLPRTIRLDITLEKQIEKYIEVNKIKFSQLINMALAKFISEPQNIQLTPVDANDFLGTAEKAFHKHRNAIDKLK